jgi:hypothetical protein
MTKYAVTTKDQGCLVFANDSEEALAEFTKRHPYALSNNTKRNVWIYDFKDKNIVQALQTADETGKYSLTYDKNTEEEKK